jgi:glycosyltransferase involved in cell wall biosynthesis
VRILVISDLPQFVVGGAEMQASRLIQAWLDRGHEVICCGRRMGADSVQIGRHTIRTHRIRVVQQLGRPGRALSYFLSLAVLLARYRSWPDVIYTRFLNEAAATAALLKQFGVLHCALVPTPANAGVNGDDKVIGALPFHRRLVRVLDAQCNAINLIAPAMADDLRALGFSGTSFRFIPNGIDLPPPAERGDTGTLRLIFVGRLAWQKGLDRLLQALSVAASATGRQFELQIVGDGPDRQALETLATRLGLAGKVIMLGEKRQGEVQELLRQSDVFVLPSRYEGLSNAGLEAMACGLPLLLTRCGGLDSYLDQDSGWIIPTDDDTALAEALRDILTTPRQALQEMGLKAREIARRNFAMSEVAERYLALFDTLRLQQAGKPQDADAV